MEGMTYKTVNAFEKIHANRGEKQKTSNGFTPKVGHNTNTATWKLQRHLHEKSLLPGGYNQPEMEHKRTDHPSTGPTIYYEGKVIPDGDLLPTLAGWPGGEQRAGHQRNIAEPTNSLRQPISHVNQIILYNNWLTSPWYCPDRRWSRQAPPASCQARGSSTRQIIIPYFLMKNHPRRTIKWTVSRDFDLDIHPRF